MARAISVILTADGKQIKDVVGSTVNELEKLNKAADRMSEKLSKADGGAKAMAVLEAAVNKLGGTSELTAAQISIVKERLERLSSIGATVPPQFAKLKHEMDQAAAAGRAMGAATGELQGRAQGLAGALGPLGSSLAAVGPAGLAAAAGIGAVALAGGAVIGVLKDAVQQAVGFGAKFQEMADNSDVAASKLQAIAGASGIGMEGVASFTAGLKKLNIELLQADAGPKFAQLGLSVRDLLAQSPEERFAAVAQAITELGTDAERAAASQELLGKAMPLATLRDFADIQEKMARSNGLGLTLDDGTTAQLKALSDEAKVLGQTWDALLVNLGATIATSPGVQEGLTGITDTLGDVNQFIKDSKGLIQDLGTVAVNAFGLIAAAIREAAGYLSLFRDSAIAIDTLYNGGRMFAGGAASAKPDKNFGAQMQANLSNPFGGGTQFPFTAGGGGGGFPFPAGSTESVGVGHAGTYKSESQRALERAEAAKLKAERERAAKAAQAEQEKLDKYTVETADAMTATMEKYDQLWSSLAGLNAGQVQKQLEQIGDMFQGRLAAGAVLSTSELEKLRLKLFELRKVSPEAFDRALEGHAGIGGILDASAGTVKFADGGGGIKRDDLAADNDREKAEAAQEFINSLNVASDGLEGLGRQIGGVAGAILSFGGAAVGTFANIKAFQANGGFAGMSSTQRVQGAASGAGELMSIWKDNRQNMSAAGGFANGAGRGAKAGAAFGPWGAAIGGIAGGLAGLFSGSGFRRMAKDAGKVLGVEMTKELAQAIDATKKKLGVGTKEAALLNISGAMDGKDPRQFGKQIEQLLSGIASKSIPAAEGMEELAKDFGAVAEAALAAGAVGDKALVGIIKRSRELGVESPEIKAFVGQQLGNAAGGIGAAVGGIQLTNADDAKSQATIFSTTFWATVKEQGIVGAADAFKDSFAKLTENLSAGGFDVSGIMGPIASIMGLAGNDAFRGASDGAAGLKAALEGVANAGYLTTDSFSAFQQQASAAFNQAVAGGASSQQAFQVIAPLLQSLVSASDNYGINLDAATQSLVEQAKAAGIAFKTDSTDRLTASIDALTVALGGVPPKVDAIGQSLRGLPSQTDLGLGQGIAYGEPAPGGGIPGYARGGYVPARPGGTLVRVGEGGRGETIVPDGAGGGGFGGVNVSIGDVIVQIPPGSSLDPEQVAYATMVALRDNIAGLASRLPAAA